MEVLGTNSNKVAKMTLDWLEEKIIILDNIFSIKLPFFWATNIIGALSFNFIFYIVVLIAYFAVPAYMDISLIIILLIYLSPINFLIYLNNCFKHKEKNEVLILEFSIFKLLINNFLYLIISFSFLYVAIWSLEYKIPMEYDNDQIVLMDKYYNTKNKMILEYKNILNNNEEISDDNKTLIHIEKELLNEKNKNRQFYKEYEERLKSFLYPYSFLENKNKLQDVRKNQKIIEEKINAIKTTKRAIGSIKDFYFNYTFIIALFFTIYIFGFISNISNLSIYTFTIGLTIFTGLLIVSLAFESDLRIGLIFSSFVSSVLYRLIAFYKKFEIKHFLPEILFYTITMAISGLYIYFIRIEEKYFSIETLNIIFLVTLIILTTVGYKKYFSSKLLSPKIIKSKKEDINKKLNL